MSKSNSKVPPKFEDESEYEAWKKDVEIWCLLTDLSEEKQALAIHLGLTGRARMASSELSVKELSDKTGVKALLTKLDSMFLQDKAEFLKRLLRNPELPSKLITSILSTKKLK